MSDNTKGTKISKSYLFGKANRQNNYFSHFKGKTGNCSNDIDDPIFTGFTLSIDDLTSPLFYGGYVEGDGLLGRITQTLDNVWAKLSNDDKYNLETPLSRDHTYGFGYGLQQNVFAEELLYGAVDYIYMVDKKYNGSAGNSNLDVSLNLNDAMSSNDDVVPASVANYESDENNNGETEEIDESENADRINELEKLIKEAQAELPDLREKDKVVNEIIDNYNFYIEHQSDAQSRLNGKKSLCDFYEDMLSEIRTDTINDIKNNDGNDIDSIYSYFLIDVSNAENEDVKVTFSTENTKDIKKTVAKDWLGTEKDYKKLDDKDDNGENRKIEILTSKVDADTTTKYEQDLLKLYTDKLNETVSTGGVYLPLMDVAKDLMKTPTEYQSKLTDIEKMQKELDKLKGNIPTDDTPTSSPNVDDTVSTTQEPSTSEYDNNYSETNEETIPQTVLDMVGFTEGFKKLTEEYPYFFLKVNGLDAAYTKYHQVKDPYYGSGDDKITIECLESLDLKVSSLFNKYFNAIYDRQYRRERVPMNLRRFNCSIFVHDIRNFRYALQNMNPNRFGIDIQNGDDALDYIVEMALNYLSVVEFKFYDCEIDPDDTGNIFNAINNEDGSEGIRTNFTFKYGNCVINFLPFTDLYQKYSQSTSKKYEPVIIANNVGDSNLTHSVKGYNSNTKYETFKDNNAALNPLQAGAGNTEYSRYWDRSVMGNVNNDDYMDYVKRDHVTAANDFIRNQYSNMFANNSVGDIQKASTELDNALRRTVLSISASVGAPPMTIADAMGMGQVYHNPSQPLPTSTTDEIGNAHTQPSDMSQLHTDIDYTTPNPTGVYRNNKKVDDIHSPKEKIEDLNKVLNNSSNLKGRTGNIGINDIIKDSKQSTESIGKAQPNGHISDFTNGIGEVNVSEDSTDTTTIIGGVDPHSYPTENTYEIGATNVAKDATNATNRLGTRNVTEATEEETTNMGKAKVTSSATSITRSIGELQSTTDASMIETNGMIGKNPNPNDTTSEIGETNVSAEPDELRDDIGKINISNKPNNITVEIGELQSTTDASMIFNNGKIDKNPKPNGATSNMGIINTLEVPTEVGETIGKTEIAQPSEKLTSDVGIVNVSAQPSENANNLGKSETSQPSNEINSNIGKAFENPQNINVNSITTQINKPNEPTDIFEDLGNVMRM